MGKETIITLLKGIWVGGTMTVPGVSGGTMAIVMGIYDKLVSSISSFFKKPKESAIFLISFCVGGLAGVILFARMITTLLADEIWGVPIQFFFVGAVAAGLPLIVKESKVVKVNWRVVLCILVGILLVVGIAQIPDGVFSVGNEGGMSGILLQLVCGFIVAIALVFPGISASQMLYMFGIYEGIMNNIANLQFLPLIPLALGLVIGIILTTKLIEKMLQKFPGATYMVILGFVLASVWELFPGISKLFNWRCLVLLVAGFMIIYWFSSRETKKE